MRALLTPAIELFLEPPKDDGPFHCYLIDHAAHTVFWIDPVDTGLLGLPPVASELHLRPSRQRALWFADHVSRSLVQGLGLQKIYWDHITYFPSHHTTSYSHMLSQLIDALIHGFTGGFLSWLGEDLHTHEIACHMLLCSLDRLRSADSGFPYSQEEVQGLLHVVRMLDGTA